jgi:hypothetical protein
MASGADYAETDSQQDVLERHVEWPYTEDDQWCGEWEGRIEPKSESEETEKT